MIRRIRRHLRRIRYYSANRAGSSWSRAANVALVASFILSVPAVLLSEHLSERTATTDEVGGILASPGPGEVYAEVVDVDRRGRWRGEPYGEWTLRLEQRQRGWPFASQVRREAAALDINRYDEADLRRNVQLAADAPERVAIEEALRAADRADVVSGWRRPAHEATRRVWRGTLSGAMVWWAAMAIAATIVIRALAVMLNVAGGRRRDRQGERSARGYCAACNYDLRGLEFNERCPECGELIW